MDTEDLQKTLASVNPIDEALDKHGVTADWWVGEMKDKAENAVITKIATWEGEITAQEEFEDNKTRLDALKELGKVGRFYPVEKHEIDLNRPLVVEIVEFSKGDCRESNDDT